MKAIVTIGGTDYVAETDIATDFVELATCLREATKDWDAGVWVVDEKEIPPEVSVRVTPDTKVVDPETKRREARKEVKHGDAQ